MVEKKPKIIVENIKHSSSFYRTDDGSWASIGTAWRRDKRIGLVCGRGTDASIPVLAKKIKSEMKRRKYVSLEPFETVIVGEEKHKYARKIIKYIESELV